MCVNANIYPGWTLQKMNMGIYRDGFVGADTDPQSIVHTTWYHAWNQPLPRLAVRQVNAHPSPFMHDIMLYGQYFADPYQHQWIHRGKCPYSFLDCRTSTLVEPSEELIWAFYRDGCVGADTSSYTSRYAFSFPTMGNFVFLWRLEMRVEINLVYELIMTFHHNFTFVCLFHIHTHNG